jgi:drug/metabolite transporter (DMT)-like permease
MSVIASAGFVVWSRRTAQPVEEARPAEEGVGRTAWQFLGATLAVSPFVLGSWWTGGSRITTVEPYQLAGAAAVLLCGLSALLAFNIGIGAVSASRAGLLFTLQPLAGAVTAVVLLGEPLVSGQAVGGGLILAGLLLLTRDRPSDPSRQPPSDIPAADTVTTTR